MANKIAQIITEKTQGKKAHERRANMRMCIAQALSVSLTKVTRLLNNTDQPTTPELATIAQVLMVTTDELIKLEE